MKRILSTAIMMFGLSLGASAAELAPEVSLKEMKKIVESKSATIIDVNSEKSYHKAHIPGAIHFADHEGKLTEVLPADKGALIVAYCGGVMCTAWKDAAKEAQAAGYTNVKHFKGGIKGWTAAKMPTESVKTETKKSS